MTSNCTKYLQDSASFSSLKLSSIPSLGPSLGPKKKERRDLGYSLRHCTMVENRKEHRCKYWATRSSVRLFAHSLTPSLTSLIPSLVGKWLIRLLLCLCFCLFSTIVHCLHRRLKSGRQLLRRNYASLWEVLSVCRSVGPMLFSNNK